MNLMDLSKATAFNVTTKPEAIKFLQNKNLIHRRRFCINNHLMFMHDGGLWRCRSCKTSCPVRSKTWFAYTKLDFTNSIMFMYYWGHEYASTSLCAHELGMSESDCVEWNNRLRRICASAMLGYPTFIGGEGLTVELDESLFPQLKQEEGHVAPEQWVFGGYCLETRECFLVAVPERSSYILTSTIKQFIRPGTKIVWNQWRELKRLSDDDCSHLQQTFSLNFAQPVENAQPAESVWAAAKFKDRIRWGNTMPDSYQCEFMWRSRLRAGMDPFFEILADIATYYRPEQ